MILANFLNKDRSVILVDDWNWEEPRQGTHDALRDLNREIIWSREIFTKAEDENNGKDVDWLQKNRFAKSEWHNGVAIFVLGKENEKSPD